MIASGHAATVLFPFVELVVYLFTGLFPFGRRAVVALSLLDGETQAALKEVLAETAFVTVWNAEAVMQTVLDGATAHVTWAAGVLAHPVRRDVVSLLAERGVAHRSELAEAIAAEDAAVDEERLEALLHHSHLPKLDHGQFVDYDPRSGDVVLWANRDAVETL